MTKEQIEPMNPEWSHVIEADDVSAVPMKVTISAGREEMNKLVQRLGVVSIESLGADLKLDRAGSPMVVHITGRIRGVLRQPCVVTLDPVDTRVDERFEAWFADPDQAIPLSKAKHDRMAKVSGREVPVLDESEDPEAIVDGQIDLGELVTQHLSLSLNPYPHGDGVVYEYGDDTPQIVPEEFKSNPFAALKDWKDKLSD